jgi:cell division septal protein FtsQ
MFLTLVTLIGYLSISVEGNQHMQVSLVELKGNIHLAKDKYIRFAELENLTENQNVDITLIRDRIAKHPYIEKVDVVIDGETIVIDIYEKRFEAIVFKDDKQFLVSEDLLMVPLLPYTEKINYPVISNPVEDKKFESLKSVKNYKDVILALKMLSSAKLINLDLYNEISEINLRDGKDILIQLSNFTYPVIIGRGSEIKKMLKFNLIWDSVNGNRANQLINYIDLRYADHIFLGFQEKNNSEEEELT